MSEINLKKNIAWSSVSKIITLISAFISNWFLSRFLGPELRGQYVYLFTLNTVIWSFMDLGVHKSFPYLLQNKKSDISSLYSFTLLSLGAGLLLTVITFIFFSPFILNLTQHVFPVYLLVLLAVYIMGFQYYMRGQFIQLGTNMIREYSIMSILPTLAFMLVLIPTFWLVPTGFRMQYSFILNVCIFVLCLAAMHLRLMKQAKLKFSFDKTVISKAYSLGFKAFLSGYLILLMMRVDLLILKQLGTFTQVGIYTLAVNFVDLINMSCNTIGAVLLAKLTSIKDDDAALIIMRKIFLVVMAINLACVIGLASTGWWLISLVYGAEYQQAYLAFVLLIPAAFGLTLGAMFNTFLWSKGFPLFTVIAPALPLALKVLLNYLLIPRYGFYGTSVASSLCYILWLTMLLIWYFTRNKDKKIGQLIATRQDFAEIKGMILSIKAKRLRRYAKAEV